jgi:hypothetical protein
MKRFQFSLRTLLLFVLGIALLMFPYPWTLRPPVKIEVKDRKGAALPGFLVELIYYDGHNGYKKRNYANTDANGACSMPAIIVRQDLFTYFAIRPEHRMLVDAPYREVWRGHRWEFEPSLEDRHGKTYCRITIPIDTIDDLKLEDQ